ncbi:MAG: potassium channel protein [Gammaproteobacteria bacterium]|nr:potassium channel protein [Gammaproteobacteria bacterium]MCP5136457.1 potassium channel protein [Gammaproteobacteria bacterium]
MNNIFFLVFRRMRAPLLVLIGVYAITILGMVLIPGQDADGKPWQMDFLHAFYFVSYMATTIGFGEIPYELTPAQRLWVTLCIYLTVIAWLYAIGKILTLLQDPALRNALTERAFAASVKRIREPFYLVCGYGDTGSQLVEALMAQDQHAVVIDKDPERVNALRLAALPLYVPGFAGDAAMPDNLVLSGLKLRNCLGVVALTNDDQVNLHIAITTKLLNPGLKVIARAEHRDVADNLASFNTNHIIDPFEVFAGRMAMALNNPCMYVLHGWLTGARPLTERLDPPRGLWVLCGYGRFGRALHARLQEEGVDTVVIESTPENTGYPPGETPLVHGWGTEADTLKEAQVEHAVGIVAGTDHDTNNLSILMTAGYLNPDLFMVVRQNRRHNAALFQAIDADLVAEASVTLASRIRTLIYAPLLIDFFRETRLRGDAKAREMVARLAGMLGEEAPQLWQLTIDPETAPAVCETLGEDGLVTVDDLVADNQDRTRKTTMVTLLIHRLGNLIYMPADDIEIHRGDQILFVGEYGTKQRQYATLQDPTTLCYVRTGVTQDPHELWVRLFHH